MVLFFANLCIQKLGSACFYAIKDRISCYMVSFCMENATNPLHIYSNFVDHKMLQALRVGTFQLRR